MASLYTDSMQSELTIALLAMLPVTELRLALPLGLTVCGLTPLSALFWSVAGNIVIATLLIYLLEPVVDFLRRHIQWVERILVKIFAHTRARHSAAWERWGALGLIALVAVPLPGSGGWTGVLVAYLFGMPRRTAVILIALGLIISGLIVLVLATGGVALFESLKLAPPQFVAEWAQVLCSQ